ncbi:MAG: recombinase zinc beta ribbon domain-containing protein, partial [bacterium]
LQTYRYYRCRRAYAGPRHDRCPTRYMRAAQLEEAVVREVVAVLSSPSVVLAELELASSSEATTRELTTARTHLASLERQRQRLVRLYQLEEIDDAYLQRETATIRAQRASSEAAIERLSGGQPIRLPESPKAFAATCAVVRSRVLADVEEGHLDRIASALQLSARVQHTAEGISGVLEGVIPHSLDEDFSHHCTNIGMSVQRSQTDCRMADSVSVVLSRSGRVDAGQRSCA